MMFILSFLLLYLSLDGVHGRFSIPTGATKIAQPIRRRRNSLHPRDNEITTGVNPCGTIIDEVNEGYIYFTAQLAFACLTNVPFHASVAERFITYINITIQFQSTLAYMKNPPEGYQEPSADILGGLQTIRDNITAAVSPDRKSPPRIYFTKSIKNISDEMPSPITTFNGQDSVEFLKEFAARNAFGSVEAHADWNQLFTTPTLDILGEESLFYGHLTFYPGNELNVTFENGTEYATDSGAYPHPDIAQPGRAITGQGIVSEYFLHDVDTAVLSIPSFEQTGPAIANFTETVAQFLSKAGQGKLLRALIDLRCNTGGTVELVFSIFKKFFPDLDPFTGSRRRSHHLASVLGESYSTRYDLKAKEGANGYETVANEWVITSRLNAATGKNFTTWSEYMSGTQTGEDRFSVTLTDAACSSACSLLVELFTRAGAHTIVIGGQPITGPMQAVGGNRGAAPYSSSELEEEIKFIGEQNFTARSLLPALKEDDEIESGVFTSFLNVNLRDQGRPNDPLPLQFRYEPADCRIFYSLDNVYNMSRLWRDVVAAAFVDSNLCIEGSTALRNNTKPPPRPPIIKQSPVHFVRPDIGFQYIFDDDDGLQDQKIPKKKGNVTACPDSVCSDDQEKCLRVPDLPCSKKSGSGTSLLCLRAATKNRLFIE
ncbi:hypothetical protein P280DRAFT_508336 [Massarina eburnea CBS 473.64]|uniref:Uncharacterized protein n=1 Tax=Massarina eburnea CBS 473.64 TaxID=1395130 RepID=A0A6A6RVK3_9PLEO|nr:hypothetical protein P280DRAFT_508336 [Massarina eburnea CBS 473.64]